MNDPNEAKELYELLSNHYVEDDGGNFRFDYSIEFLTWALTPPGAKPDWLIGVRGWQKEKTVWVHFWDSRSHENTRSRCHNGRNQFPVRS
jgi:hypothetical protein